MTGLLGSLLAASLVIQCTLTGYTPQPTLTCNDRERSILVIPYSEWPQRWHGPELGFTYMVDDQWRTLPSVQDKQALAESIRKSRNEQRRWHQNRNIREGREP